MIHIYPQITKDFILKRLSQEEIMEKYLSVFVNFDRSFCSPLRPDNNPTCRFKWVKNKLIFKDFRGDIQEDCFGIVKRLFNLNYDASLYKIARDFKLIDGTNKIYEERKLEVISYETQNREIKITPQEWTREDKLYWLSYNINGKTLKRFYGFSCSKVYLDNRCIYSYNLLDPAYGYYFGKGEWKIYFPLRDKKRKWLSNTKSTTIQGFSQLPDYGENLIITKSYKDVMSLYNFGFNSIAPQGETIGIREDTIKELKKRFKNIYSLYDFDKAGIKGAFNLRDKYDIPALFLTNGKFNSKDFGAKDFSDYVRNNGIEKTKELINYALQNLGIHI